MDGMLSQEEINALLNSMSSTEPSNSFGQELLNAEEKDAIGEISNISMGTAATTLSQLVNSRVLITTPKVELASWKEVSDAFDKPCVYIQISYRQGLDGNNILILRERDVMVIADLMMGGTGNPPEGEVTELHLSAISEAMNQMMGSAATSLSSMIERLVDITPPEACRVTLEENLSSMYPTLEEPFVKVSFRMEIENLVDSEIMQLYSVDFAKDLYRKFISGSTNGVESMIQTPPAVEVQPQVAPQIQAQVAPQMQPQMQQQMQPQMQPHMTYQQPEINVAPAQFQTFNSQINPVMQQENIDLIRDVPLEVTVELGRTTKSIKEILDFAPGTIIELNKLAGEPIDVLVNGKYVAKGEVVVIEESFGIRVTEIIK